jgi:hypothetical protein
MQSWAPVSPLPNQACTCVIRPSHGIGLCARGNTVVVEGRHGVGVVQVDPAEFVARPGRDLGPARVLEWGTRTGTDRCGAGSFGMSQTRAA